MTQMKFVEQKIRNSKFSHPTLDYDFNEKKKKLENSREFYRNKEKSHSRSIVAWVSISLARKLTIIFILSFDDLFEIFRILL